MSFAQIAIFQTDYDEIKLSKIYFRDVSLKNIYAQSMGYFKKECWSNITYSIII